MPDISISQQPTAGSLFSAYRPIEFTARVTNNIVPFVFDALTAGGYLLAFNTIYFRQFYQFVNNGSSGGGCTIVITSNTGTATYTSANMSIQKVFNDQMGVVIAMTTSSLPAGWLYNCTMTINGIPIINLDLQAAPTVCCDVYMDNVYYKTIAKTQYDELTSSFNYWKFDLQDVCQEVLTWQQNDVGDTYVINPKSSARFYCKFRFGTYDSNGLVTMSADAPLQATGADIAVSGGGLQSNYIVAVYCTLQHAEKQILANYLAQFKYGTFDASVLPLSNRQGNYRIRRKYCSDFYPIIFTATQQIDSLIVYYRLIGDVLYTTFNYSASWAQELGGTIILIGMGQKNLHNLSAGAIDFRKVADYYVCGYDNHGGILFRTPKYVIDNFYADDMIRIGFVSYTGQFDCVDFNKPKITHEDKAGEYQIALHKGFSRRDAGVKRYNITANDTYEAKLKCKETDMPWLQQLVDSPQLFMEESRTDGQPDDYIPVVKVSSKFEKLKNEREFDYELILQFKLANEIIALRN